MDINNSNYLCTLEIRIFDIKNSSLQKVSLNFDDLSVFIIQPDLLISLIQIMEINNLNYGYL